jgi:L-rhamnose mutarotase
MERVCFLLQVRPDMLTEYKRRHTQVWPEMLEALTKTGWRNYSLFLREDGLLVGYLETDNFAESLRQMAATDINERWQREMKSFFVNNTGRPDQVLERLEEVFHLA